MKALRIILFILMIISITLSTIYTLYRIPDYLGFCYKRTILFPNDNEIEAIQKALELSFPEGTEVKRIRCSYSFDPYIFGVRVYMKLPQNDEGRQFIELFYSIDKTPVISREENEKSYNKDGSFVIKTSTKHLQDNRLVDTLIEMSKYKKPIASIYWAITIIIIISYKIVSKKYKKHYKKQKIS